MKIISPFKDYYDYVSMIYGVDPLHVYHRPVTISTPVDSVISVDDCVRFTHNPLTYGWYYPKEVLERLRSRFYFHHVSFCGHLIIVIEDNNTSKCFIPKTDNEMFEFVDQELTKKELDNLSSQSYRYRHSFLTRFSRNKPITFYDFDWQPNKKLIHLSKRLNQPVFFMPEYAKSDKKLSYREIFNNNRTPLLAQLGFPSVLSPEIAYQMIDHFVSNVLSENADMQPPVEVSDKDKIKQHGFDLKHSFRGKQ